MNKEAVLSISGGLDSTALLVHLLNKDYKKIHAISFYYGQKNEIELQINKLKTYEEELIKCHLT